MKVPSLIEEPGVLGEGAVYEFLGFAAVRVRGGTADSWKKRRFWESVRVLRSTPRGEPSQVTPLGRRNLASLLVVRSRCMIGDLAPVAEERELGEFEFARTRAPGPEATR